MGNFQLTNAKQQADDNEQQHSGSQSGATPVQQRYGDASSNDVIINLVITANPVTQNVNVSAGVNLGAGQTATFECTCPACATAAAGKPATSAEEKKEPGPALVADADKAATSGDSAAGQEPAAGGQDSAGQSAASGGGGQSGGGATKAGAETRPAPAPAAQTAPGADSAAPGVTVSDSEADNNRDFSALPVNTRGGFVGRALKGLGSQMTVPEVLKDTRYEQVATRAEIAAMCARLLGLGSSLEGQPGVFNDVPLSHWAAAVIYRGREAGLFSGVGGNKFLPDAPISAEHAGVILNRVLNPSARAPFDRKAAVAASIKQRNDLTADSAPEPASSSKAGGESNSQGDDVAVEVAKSMSAAEGTAPNKIHYDSGVVNWGVGSNTGVHIAKVLDKYEEIAKEKNLLPTLYNYFGGQSQFNALRNRFRTQGQKARINQSEVAALKNLGNNQELVEAQHLKAGDDVAQYLDSIGKLNPPYPYKDANNTISEAAAHVFAHAAHQSGSVAKPYGRAISNVGNPGRAGERALLDAVAKVITGWVQPRYREGVRNRYNHLFAKYGNSSRRYQLPGGPKAPETQPQQQQQQQSQAGTGLVIEGQLVHQGMGATQDADRVANAAVQILDAKGQVQTVGTNANGFFALRQGLQPGTYTVVVGSQRVPVTIKEDQPVGWVKIVLGKDEKAPPAPADAPKPSPSPGNGATGAKKPPGQPGAAPKTVTYTVNASALNVRSSPSMSGDNVIGQLPGGTTVKGTPAADGWVKVDYNGQVGYVSAQHVGTGAGAGAGGQAKPAGNGRLASPVPGVKPGSGFGPRFHPILKRNKMHNGIDYPAGAGTSIKAAGNGTVVFAGWNDGGFGNFVQIDHGNGMQTWYAHMLNIAVKKGQAVKQGDSIGAVGSTGRSTGPHLHFEVRVNGTPQNPANHIG